MAQKTGLIPQFTTAQINTKIAIDLIEFNNALIKSYKYIGEQIVNNARMNANFTDQTGNLRHSIGYKVYNNGRSIEENFQGSDEGMTAGKSIADELGKSTKGINLIVVAGMDYASYVEDRGYDVISGSILSKNQVDEYFKVFFIGL